MAKCVSIISNRLGVLIRLLISKVNTVIFPIDDITIRILLNKKLIVIIYYNLTPFVQGLITCIQLFLTYDHH